MTNFNCACEDTNDALTLAQYRVKMLQRAGFAAIAANPPPGTADLFNTFLQDAQDFLYLKYPALRTRRFFRWTLQQDERYYGLRDNTENWTDYEGLEISALGVVTFPDAAPANNRQIFFTPPADQSVVPDGITAFQRYYVVNSVDATCNFALTEGGEPITEGLEAGTADVMVSPGAECIFNFAPYKDIEGAWLVDLNGAWLPMVQGIPPTFYTTVNQPALPCRFEIRQCIEVFPAPPADGYQLYIKGHFGKAAFTADADKPTIDGQLVYLWALADALDYYNKPGAANVRASANSHLQSLVAGTHGAKRYIPGARVLPPAVMPVALRFSPP